MTRTTCLLAIAISVSMFATGCPAADDGVPLPPPRDGGDSATDSSSESGGDVADADVAETDGGCTAGDLQKRACGKCGTQLRTCASGVWKDWLACEGELATAECAIDETRNSPCGNCGMQKDTCDPTACTWSAGSCAAEGPCAAGDSETTTASCTTAGEIRTRTCSDKCMWSAFSACELPRGWIAAKAPPTGFAGRYGNAAVWTGKVALLWGGVQVDTIGDTSALADGASYDVAGDAWTKLPAPPSALSVGRMYPAAVYGAGQLLVWGGAEGGSATSFTVKATGARYDSTAATWSAMSSTGAPSARSLAGAVWSTTTSQMIVWGGCTAIDTFNTCTAFSASGGAYDPATDTWTALPAAPPGFEARANHSMVWTGSDVVIWGGGTDAAAYRNGARYNPTTKLWTTVPTPPTAIVGRLFHVSVTSGTELLVYGGSDATQSTAYDTGARYLPGGSWTAFAIPGAAELPTTKRFNAQGWYGGGKLYVWSGLDDLFTGLANGASYDPVADKWTAMPSKGAPAARGAASVVWTGKEAFVWGGIDASSLGAKADGAIFRP